MSTAVAEPTTDPNVSAANAPASDEENSRILESLTLTPADLDSMDDEQIAERLKLIQQYASTMKLRVRQHKAKEKRIETVGSTIGALVSRSNDLVRAQFNLDRVQKRLTNAQNTYNDTLAAYLRVNEIDAIPAEAQSQIDEANAALRTKLSSAASRVKKSADGDSENADENAADENAAD